MNPGLLSRDDVKDALDSIGIDFDETERVVFESTENGIRVEVTERGLPHGRVRGAVTTTYRVVLS